MDNIKILFPLDPFEELIIEIGYDSLEKWVNFWEKKNGLLSTAYSYYGQKSKDDWIWGLVLPILSDAYCFKRRNDVRKIIGLSALPGTGKTTLGLLLEKLSLKLDFKISVVSLDDFYMPSNEMEKAIKDNPWNVSRGFPGSHSLDLMENNLKKWKQTGELNVPIYDKSLRNGLGDRLGWREDSPDLVILEGWFLGVTPIHNNFFNNREKIKLLTSEELHYVQEIQKELHNYLKIWKLIDKIWRLKPEKYSYMNNWKIQQEKEMLYKKGNALIKDKLDNFLRMLNTCIPQESFDEINSDSLIILNERRKLIWIGKNKN